MGERDKSEPKREGMEHSAPVPEPRREARGEDPPQKPRPASPSDSPPEYDTWRTGP